MQKFGWLICLIVFVFVTVFVISLDSSTTQTRRVRFSNQNFEIKHTNTEVSNDNSVKIKTEDAKINNTQIATNTSDVKLNNASGFKNSNVSFDNTDIDTQDTSYSDSDYDFSNQDTEANSSGKLNFDNLDDSHLDSMLEDAKKVSTKPLGPDNRPFKIMKGERYEYQNISWNTWRSNFVNAVLEASLDIKELDEYGEGSWFHYSFNVDDEGRISNISVTSMYLEPYVKDKVASMIKGFAYSEYTVFPANTKRKAAKVSAIMVLSNETKKARPSDFNDVELIKTPAY